MCFHAKFIGEDEGCKERSRCLSAAAQGERLIGKGDSSGTFGAWVTPGAEGLGKLLLSLQDLFLKILPAKIHFSGSRILQIQIDVQGATTLV